MTARIKKDHSAARITDRLDIDALQAAKGAGEDRTLKRIGITTLQEPEWTGQWKTIKYL